MMPSQLQQLIRTIERKTSEHLHLVLIVTVVQANRPALNFKLNSNNKPPSTSEAPLRSKKKQS